MQNLTIIPCGNMDHERTLRRSRYLRRDYTDGVIWTLESPYCRVDFTERPSAGAPSLKHLALKRTLYDQRLLTKEHFESIPWPIAKEMWEYLKKSGRRTMYMWMLLCSVYSKEFGAISPHCRMIADDKLVAAGRHYWELITSPSLSWVTALRVWTHNLSTRTLVEIASIKNLVALEILTPYRPPVDGYNDFTDRVIRAWSEMAETTKAFEHLWLLKIYGPHQLTPATFRFLSRIRSLKVCAVARCDGLSSTSAIKYAEECGWSVYATGSQVTKPYKFQMNDGRLLRGRNQPDWEIDEPWKMLATSVPEDTPVLDFSVGQYDDSEPFHVDVFRRDDHRSDDPGSDGQNNGPGKKRKGDPTRGVPERSKTRVMKSSRTKDLSRLLSEFV